MRPHRERGFHGLDTSRVGPEKGEQRETESVGKTRIIDEEGHPVVGTLLLLLRDEERQRDRARFRGAMRQLGMLLGYEVARDLPTRAQEVRTCLGSRTEPIIAEPPVLATMLRAGMPLLEGMLDALPDSPCMIFGAARREGTLAEGSLEMPIDLSYEALTHIEGRTLVYVDPMIATGSTIRALHPRVCEKAGQPARVIVVGAIGYRGALEMLQEKIGAEIVVASADDELNERGYIIPGLGDAGDLLYGPKM